AEIRAATTSLRAIVHNASAFSETAENLDEDVALFERFFRVHMLAPYVLNRELLDLLRASPQKPADIVHLTDIYAERPNPDFATYCATKAGLANLTRSLAKRYAPDVKVNAIAPGPILFREEHTEENRRAVLSKTPLGVEGGPEAIYLALKAVLDNYYITGAVIPVDGGRSLAE
ncbi:MAG: SDR family oxidoreductase, partial [Calditrichaeota bacterium]|nr:SDR family oxidoreductase [Calditrichota bacterium]